MTNTFTNKYIGTSKIMNNGMKATIVAYRKRNDVDIQFEDGTIVYNKAITNFSRGKIGNPNQNKQKNIGLTNTMKNGLIATIIEYRSSLDVDVQFEDGIIVQHKQMVHFKEGDISHPIINTKINTGEKKYLGLEKNMNNGMKATIIAYHRNNDIDVQFEDGTVVCNKRISLFLSGQISHPNINIINKRCENEYLGLTNTMKNGLMATIIVYRKNDDIDVQFEDGTIVYNKEATCFFKGEIAHPDVNTSLKRSKNKYLGMINTMNNGMKATIITYRNYMDIDVQFKDGTVVKNKTVSSFKRGTIAHPGVDNTDYSNAWIWQGDKYLGEENIMNNGMKATVIEYHAYNCIDVEFEDGTVVYNKSMGCFKNGTIGYPNKFEKKYLGMINTMNNGMKATVIEYRNKEDVDVQFEDGTIVQHKQIQHFKNGAIGYPGIK